MATFLYHLEKGKWDQALHEAHRFRMLNELPWDPILRAAAAAHLGEKARRRRLWWVGEKFSECCPECGRLHSHVFPLRPLGGN